MQCIDIDKLPSKPKITALLYWWTPIGQDSFYFKGSVNILLKHTSTGAKTGFITIRIEFENGLRFTY